MNLVSNVEKCGLESKRICQLMLLKRENSPLDWVSRQIGVFVKGKNPLNQISAAGNFPGRDRPGCLSRQCEGKVGMVAIAVGMHVAPLSGLAPDC